MKRYDDVNIIDRFLYKMLICTILLLMVIFLGKMKVLDIEKLQTELSQHYNFIPLLKAINGEEKVLIPVDLDDAVAVINVAAYQNSRKYTSGTRKVILKDMEGVENYRTGVVVKIQQNKDQTFQITVKGIDNYEYVYDRLESITCNIYKVVESGEIIGSPITVSGENYFNFAVYDKDQIIDIFS